MSKQFKSADELADSLFDTQSKPQKKQFVPNGQKKETSDRLNVLSQSTTYKGGFGTYTVTNKMVEIMFDDTQALDKNTLADFVEELSELGGLMQ